MSPELSVPDRPVLREGTAFKPLKKGAVHLSGPRTDAFIIDDGTATVLQACDGRSLEELSAAFREQYGWELSAADITDLLGRWAHYGYLEGSDVRSRRLVRFDPGRLLDLLRPLQGLYGKRPVAAAALLLAGAGYVLTVLKGPGLLAALSDVIRAAPPAGAVAAVVAYYLGYSVTAFFHELGHALAIRRWGGEVPEIGIQKSGNFYVLSNREVLEDAPARIWYYAGGLLSDTVWWAGAWVWWLSSPGPVPLFLLVPQCLYFLIYAFAPSGASDMALILREAAGWKPIPRVRKGTPWRSAWAAAPRRQVALEVLRNLLGACVVVYTAFHDVLLLVLYAGYRFVRKTMQRL